MATEDQKVISNLTKIQTETADHIGDLYEKTSQLESDLNTLQGTSAGQSLADAQAALEAAKLATEQAAQAAQESTEISNQAIEAAQAVTDEAKAIIAEASLLSSDSSDTSFFDTEYLTTSPAIAVETQNNVNGFYRLVRDFVVRAKPWTQAIRYHTKPDERFDFTLVSRRVYGSSDEYITVMAAAGLDSVENELEQQLLTLPTASQLNTLKLQAGYRSTEYGRANN